MKHGFIKAAAVSPHCRVADPVYNREQICKGIDEAAKEGAAVIVFPELCLSGYTCGDLFLQESLLASCKEQLLAVRKHTEGVNALVFAGLPLQREGKLYNVAAAICNGEILAFIPKVNLPSYGEFFETRYFYPGNKEAVFFEFEGKKIPFGANILLQATGMEELLVGCELCEDLMIPHGPGVRHALAGAVLLVNLSASNEAVGKDDFRELLIRSASARGLSGYVYTSAGEGESTQDLVFGGYKAIAENGRLLSGAGAFSEGILYGDIDIHRLLRERRRINTFGTLDFEKERYVKVLFELAKKETALGRSFACLPFVPEGQAERAKRCEEILTLQSYGLKKRYEHTGCQKAVIGISGGLDSALALLVTVKTFDLLSVPRENIIAVTMPCFGTTDRTYQNACRMTGALGVSLEEVDMKEAVILHFRDIGQDMANHDVTYENAQARERTQILMDIANRENALVIGTGDMSELALGWATYNGDHMSMYGVNAGVPKTLVRHLVQHYADSCGVRELKEALLDVLATPVSPELLPPVDGVISQKTEDLVGPYELHDFFLYYMLRWGYEPSKIFRIAGKAFAGAYEDAEILKWLKTFYRRFFAQQFKRSCLPDGPKVGSVGVSPRGDLKMPSDACVRIWMEEIERL